MSSEKLECTYASCSEEATRIMDRGGLPVAGRALSEQAQKIGGIR